LIGAIAMNVPFQQNAAWLRGVGSIDLYQRAAPELGLIFPR
jgi:hypothetical protein